MDIFSLINPAPNSSTSNSIDDFNKIISIARQNHWLGQYPPSIVQLDCYHSLNVKGYYPFLTIPWPSWNEEWTKECVKLCNIILSQFTHLTPCHYQDLLDQVKYPGGTKPHILFFDKKDLGML